MGKKIAFFIFTLCYFNLFSLETPINEIQWKKVWSDEFDGNQLDSTKWKYQIGNGFWGNDTWIYGWGNNEKEYYTDREKNIAVKGGKLLITAIKENFEGDQAGKKANFSYTSGKILTKDLFAKKYGRFEIKAKLPNGGKGLWPAIWLLPNKEEYGIWAASGEIDIMEGWGSKINQVAGTLHYGEAWPKNIHTGKEYVFKNSDVSEWHEYALEWTPGVIKWFVDGELYQTQSNWYSKNNNEAVNYTFPAPFDKEYYVILNLAVGGWFDGETDEKTKFPAVMEVDYVRVYDLEGGYDENVKKPELKKETNNKQESNKNLLVNGDFSNEDSDWQLLSHFGGKGTFEFEENEENKYLKTQIEDGGPNSYSIQIIHEAPVIKGQWYKLSFEAKSEENREISAKVGGGESRGWAQYFANTYNLTKNMGKYISVFQMGAETDKIAKVEFHGGLSNINFWLGNVSLEPIDNPDEVLQSITKLPLSNGNVLYNGTFDQGNLDRMIFWNIDTDKSRVYVKDRKLVIKKSNDKSKVAQTKIPLLKGSTYQIKFNGSSELQDEISIKVVGNNKENIYFEKNINLSKDFKEYIYEFTAVEEDSNASFSVETASSKDDIILDNFFMKKKADYKNVNKEILNETFAEKESLASWNSWMGGPYGFGGEFQASINKNKLKILIKDTGKEEWSNAISKNINLQKGMKYKISFDVSSSITRDMKIIIEDSNYTKLMAKQIEINKKEQIINLDFNAYMGGDFALKFIIGNVGNTQNRPHEIKIGNVKLEVIEE